MTTDTNEALMQTFLDTDQLKKDISIDLTDITGGMQQQAALYVHYAGNSVRARRQYERFKVAVEVLEAQLEAKHRTRLKEENPKVTEPAIRAAVVSDPSYKAANARLIDAQQIFRMCEVAERSFDHRKDMLLQIARDAAREQGGPLRVSANQVNADRKEGLLDAMKRNAESKVATDAASSEINT